MKRLITLCTLLTLATLASNAQPLHAPFDLILPSYDSTRSAWLPWLETDSAGAHGVLRTNSEGHFAFADGTPARFVGVTLPSTACFPDSLTAIATAGRLRKLGVNMVRFIHFDNHNSDAASTLAPGRRSDTLSPTQMARLDWFLHQLKRRGIYAHFVLKSRNGPRRDDNVPGWDSTYGNGQYITYFSEPFQRMQRTYMEKLLTHRNPHTGLRYADDPMIALMTIVDGNSIYDQWVNDRLNQRANVLSYHHSRLLDTLFAGYLRKKYGSTAALKEAYWEGARSVGQNIVRNPGFESFNDNWTLVVNEGAQANAVIVQGNGVAEGANSMRIAVRQVNGTENRIYLEQVVPPVRRHAIYRLRFMARTDTAAGRQLRVYFFRNSAPTTSFGADTTVTLTTSWQTFSLTFRCNLGDSITPTLRFFMGRTRGDVFLDGVSIQETGREGLASNESLEAFTVDRTRFRDAPKISLRRMLDLGAFYDSLGRAYYRGMSAHLRSLGVRAPLAGTNINSGSADLWAQSEYDFTSRTAQWDFNGARQGLSYSDSTWVIRNYSILTYRDQRIPDFSRSAIVGKPFIAESYTHAFPNAHRSEMMLYYPAYASLHDWDGIYFSYYSDRSAEMADRRRFIKDDFLSFIADPSITALMPQLSAIVRNRWIAPAERTIAIRHDEEDLRMLPLNYAGRSGYFVDGNLSAVASMVSAIRVDSFDAKRHYTAGDYYFTVPEDDNIQSDTREIDRDMTKGVMTVNTPMAQGGSGMFGAVSSLRTDALGVSWIAGGAHATYLWSTLDTTPLATAPRSLLTVTTRALNAGAAWQFGDSSLGKNWGATPIQMESVKLGVNFYTDADSIILHPLDTLGRPTDRTIGAVRASGSWRVTLDLGAERTPWFGVEQVFEGPTVGVADGSGKIVHVGEVSPNPVGDHATIELRLPGGTTPITATIHDALGRTVEEVAVRHTGRGLSFETEQLPSGVYTLVIAAGDRKIVRRFVAGR